MNIFEVRSIIVIALSGLLFSACGKSSDSIEKDAITYLEAKLGFQVENFKKTDSKTQNFMGTEMFYIYFDCDITPRNKEWVAYNAQVAPGGEAILLRANQTYHISGELEMEKYQSGYKGSTLTNVPFQLTKRIPKPTDLQSNAANKKANEEPSYDTERIQILETLAIVKAPKAYFYTTTDLSTKRKAYCIKGDFLTIEKVEKDFVFVVYKSKASETKGWMQRSDLQMPK